MVEGASFFGAALLPLGLDSLPSLTQNRIRKFINIRRDHVRVAVWSWLVQRDNGPKHESKSTPERLQKIKPAFWSGYSEHRPQPNRDAVEWPKESFTPDIWRIWLSWCSSVRTNGPGFLLNIVQVWSAATRGLLVIKSNLITFSTSTMTV